MKKILVALTFMAGISFFQCASAQEYKTALGIRLSSNPAVVGNGITFKYFLNEKAAIEGILAFSDPVAIGALYEIHNPISTPGLQWFYGAGAYVGFNTVANLGAQGIVGLDYKFQNIPINISLDWKPELNLIESVSFEAGAIGFSARFTFGKQ
jgi:hypothetical protein